MRTSHWLYLALVSQLLACGAAAPAPGASQPARAAAPATTVTSPQSPDSAPASPSVDATSESAFTESALALFRAAAGDLEPIISEPLQIAFVTPMNSGTRVNLDRIWRGCRATPDACEANLRDFVTQSAKGLHTREAPVSRDSVFPVLRSKDYMASVGGDDAGITEPFTGDLAIYYVVDSPEAIRSLTARDVTALAIATKDVGALALENLRKRLGELPDGLTGQGVESGGVIFRQEYFESSRLLLVDQWRGLAARTKRRLFVTIPGNDVLFFAIGGDGKKLAQVAAAVYAKHARSVSTKVFALTAKGWVAEGT